MRLLLPDGHQGLHSTGRKGGSLMIVNIDTYDKSLSIVPFPDTTLTFKDVEGVIKVEVKEHSRLAWRGYMVDLLLLLERSKEWPA